MYFYRIEGTIKSFSENKNKDKNGVNDIKNMNGLYRLQNIPKNILSHSLLL